MKTVRLPLKLLYWSIRFRWNLIIYLDVALLS